MKKVISIAILFGALTSNLYALTCPAFDKVMVKGTWVVPYGWQLKQKVQFAPLKSVVLFTANLFAPTKVPDLGTVECIYAENKYAWSNGSLSISQGVPLNGGQLLPVDPKNGYWGLQYGYQNYWACDMYLTDVNLCTYDVQYSR